jgi:hypothetical protein
MSAMLQLACQGQRVGAVHLSKLPVLERVLLQNMEFCSYIRLVFLEK